MKAKFIFIAVSIMVHLNTSKVVSQPDWTSIKAGVTFIVPDTNYLDPVIQPINVGGWEDGLFITRDGRHLFSTYMPLDIISWLGDFTPCINFMPYFRPPLLGIDTVTNPFGCPNYIHSDIIISSRADTGLPFNPWTNSNLATPATFEGGAHSVLLNADTFDVFVYTSDIGLPWGMEIMFMKNIPVNPNTSTAVPIVSSSSHEDNPHIERLNDTTLLLFFDRERYIYYSLSTDNGNNWQSPIQITNVLNDQAPYDVQPHLWNDGTDWWVYFCSNNTNGIRCIYKSKQQIANDWDSWAAKELVIEPSFITGNPDLIFAVGEPTLTHWGDLSFVVVYGSISSADTTDVFDCDPWILPRKPSPILSSVNQLQQFPAFKIYPNPAGESIYISINNNQKTQVQIFNSLSVLIKQMSISNSTQIDIKDLPNGLYFITLNDNWHHTTKFIKTGH